MATKRALAAASAVAIPGVEIETRFDNFPRPGGTTKDVERMDLLLVAAHAGGTMAKKEGERGRETEGDVWRFEACTAFLVPLVLYWIGQNPMEILVPPGLFQGFPNKVPH